MFGIKKEMEDPEIVPTIDYLKEKFKKYNHLYFNDILKLPVFSFECKDHIAGEFRCRFVRKDGQWKLTHKRIHINGNILWNEQTLRSVLIHEMIHYYVQLHKKVPSRDGDFQHWGLFWLMKVKLNWKYGLNIKNNYFELKLKTEQS